MVPAFIVMLGLAVWWRQSERRMLTAALARRSPARPDPRHRHRLGGATCARDVPAAAFARQHGGSRPRRRCEDYQQAAIELGFLHHRYLRGTAPADFAARGQDVRRRGSTRCGPYVAFPGQVVPHR